MHLSSRLNFALLGGVAAVSMLFSAYQAVWEMHTLRDEVQRQALVLAESQQRIVEGLLENGSHSDLQGFADQFQNHERLRGVGIYDPLGGALAVTSKMTPVIGTAPNAVLRALETHKVRGQFFNEAGIAMHVLALPISSHNRLLGAVAVFHNVGYTGSPVWRQAFSSLAQTLLIVGITLLVIRWSVGKHLHKMTEWLRDLRAGRASLDAGLPKEEIFQPLASEVTRLATSLNEARAAAEQEARLRDAAQARWTSERLRISVQSKLNGSRLFAVSNREPYEHTRQGGEITWKIPPSGLVTALEPVLRACDGTWIAQGTGPADRDTADSRGRLRVPPDRPQYTLRRVWLTKEEEEGFYFGFANEGLWPLCHIAHTRPIFRAEDWEQYRAVNWKFARALVEEMRGEKDPVVLVQDYHFALLPQMVKQERPDARVAIFWHIPWPNPEAFGICPWQKELLDGMLGADLIGFHIQAHCNNFLESVDRALESRIDREHFAVNRREHLTAVKPFPISVDFGGDNDVTIPPESSRQNRAALFRQLDIDPIFLGLGVDRVDYTKGIQERFRGIERLLEQYPIYRGNLTFVQIGAPSRTHIRRYQELMAEVSDEAERINRRFRSGSWKPIIFLNRHHSHAEIQQYYQAADFCMVTALHDGMNLVAKEYAAARHDEQGVLILSRFTGASHELADALIVNPYDVAELASAIHTALTMPAEDRRARMRRMRAVIRENNVYRWAGNLIGEVAGIRLEPAEPGGATEGGAAESRFADIREPDRVMKLNARTAGGA
ncbi:MAG TPA: trehalose-6-phosphate synthase [Bryobacteraceae bacterium]|nr:trehalose-6-phosphate synthase [Bryobacteraceae bacterium]